jgi:hypothetical protein
MESQGESTAMATSSTHATEPTPRPTLSADQPLPHLFTTLLDLQEDVSHLLQIVLEQGSKIQEQDNRIKELSSVCELLRETQLDNRVGLRAIHDHLLPQSKGKEPEGAGRVSFRQTHRNIKPEKDSFRKAHSSESESESTDENIRIRDFFPRSKYSTSTPQKKKSTATPAVITPAPATPAATLAPPPAAPVLASATTATIAIPKLSSPDGYDGKKKGRPARQWMARVLAWMELSRAAFPNERAVLLYLLHLLKDEAANWAEPHLRKVLDSSPGALSTIQDFVEQFYNAFDDPDAERAAERKIHELTQDSVPSKSTAEYTTEFRNLAADLDWGDSAFMATFRRGLHWKVKEILSQKETQPRTLEEFIQIAVQIDNVRRENEANRPQKTTPKKVTVTTPAPVTIKRDLKALPNYVDENERKRRKDAGLCIKCGNSGHTIKDCKVGWKVPKAKEEKAKVAEEKSEGSESGKE